MSLSVVILAAGQGSRMKSNKAKVIHELAGKPMLQHVIDAAKCLAAEEICVVYGHGGDQVKAAIDDETINWALQAEQLGTGHAVQQALPNIKQNNTVLILYGDVPLISSATLSRLIAGVDKNTIGLLTVNLNDPTGYGRILRNANNQVIGIVEQKDASVEQLTIDEVNTGIMAVTADRLRSLLAEVNNNNAQKEYYLTDIIALQKNQGGQISVEQPASIAEVEGVNTKLQLASLERVYQRSIAETLMLEGAILADPARLDCRGNVSVGRDSFIDANVIFEGEVRVGENCIIETGVVIRDSIIGDNCRVKAHSILEQAELRDFAQVGPFARLRPGALIDEQAHVGNFVEIKKTHLGKYSKASHLSYLGDAKIGEQVNIGAGTITCNYDGANKHLTVLEDNVFVGSDTQLVAPVVVGQGATIGAGTTVTADVPAEQLVVSRVKQKLISHWQRPTKTKR